jgi:putative Ca2+/H+ antiporter (TMEM165/GDT1 family)
LTIFFASLVFVVLSEMGDKTQLLAMAFASRYRWQTVLWAVFWATLCNHFLAVLAGDYLTAFLPVHYVKIAAAVSFILFGLWTLRGDTLNNEDQRSGSSPFWAVAVGMFIAEMGDKTQLATFVLAARYENIIPVWMGTTSGMVIADAIGILVAVVLGKKIPERFVKWFAATIFIVFGLLGLYDAIPRDFWTWTVLVGGVALLVAAMYAAVKIGRKTEPQEMVCKTGEEDVL